MTKVQEKESLEEGADLNLKFGSDGLIPVITQDQKTGDILMQAYMNQEAFDKTVETGQAHYWSRSRQSLWHKGATSGQTQDVVEMRTDCDQDSILLTVVQNHGKACHTGRRSCFYRKIVQGKENITLQHIK